MALILCSECQKEISDMASVCPHCGLKRSVEAKNLFLTGIIFGGIAALVELVLFYFTIILSILVFLIACFYAGGKYKTRGMAGFIVGQVLGAIFLGFIVLVGGFFL
jgi:hypothetical protein